jgi:hypothetical protein
MTPIPGEKKGTDVRLRGTIEAMSPMDVPGPSHPLAGSFDERRAGDPRRPYPDRGAARSPAELLDELRLRLSQLPENHPSAPREKGDARPRGWPERPEPPERPGRAARPDRPERPDGPERADLPEQSWKADQPDSGESEPDSGERGPDASEPEPEPDASEPVPGEAAERSVKPAKADDKADGSAGGLPGGLLDWLRDVDAAGMLPDLAGWGTGELDLGWPGHPETYRPWFMAGEPSAPWFAAGDDL